MSRSIRLLLALSVCLLTPHLVYAQDEIVLFEPFTTSNMNPFTQIHGIPTTRSANLVGEKKFELQLQTDFANSFTDNREGTEFIAIDGETRKATLGLRYGFSDRWEAGADIPYVRHTGGSLDNFIENWHDWFGLPEGGRKEVPQDLLRYYYENAGQVLVNQTRSAGGIGDVRLHLGYRLNPDSTTNRVWSVRAGVKLPTGDADDLLGTDSTDVFASLHLSDPDLLSNPNLYFHGSLGVTALGDSELLPDQVEDYAVFGSSNITWAVGKVSLKAQLDFHSALYDSDVKELGDFAMQLVLGGSLHLGQKAVLDISVAEDVITDTSPDVVFQLGLRSNF